MNKVAKSIQRAKINLLLKEAFFGNLLMHLKIEPDTKRSTFCTNGKCIKYSPAYAGGLTRDEISGVLAHEVMHCVFKHHLERNGRDFKLYNDAGDYCINPILVESGFRLPGRPLLDSRFAGMTTIQIYNILFAENPPKENPPKGKPDQNSQDGKGEDEGAGNQGDQNDTNTSCGEIEDSSIIKESGGSDAIEQESKAWNQRIIQAAMNAKMAGRMPVGLDRLITDLLTPKVSWKEILWQFVQEAAEEDYSFLRPNRKYMTGGVYLPSLQSESSITMVVAVDTSGSISEKDLNQAASELAEIQSVMSATIHAVYVDATFQSSQVFYPEDEIKLEAKGGGGTDFRPAFEWIEKEELDIDCMVYLTDGYCSSFPEQEPEYPVLWITDREHWSTPFGEVVLIGT